MFFKKHTSMTSKLKMDNQRRHPEKTSHCCENVSLETSAIDVRLANEKSCQ